MPDTKKNEKKYDLILDALQQLLEEKKIQNISVSEIAQRAGIGKGSIYYYFPSKEAILDALIERSYEKPLLTAQNLAAQTSHRLHAWQCCFRHVRTPPRHLSSKTAAHQTMPVRRTLPFYTRNTCHMSYQN